MIVDIRQTADLPTDLPIQDGVMTEPTDPKLFQCPNQPADPGRRYDQTYEHLTLSISPTDLPIQDGVMTAKRAPRRANGTNPTDLPIQDGVMTPHA